MLGELRRERAQLGKVGNALIKLGRSLEKALARTRDRGAERFNALPRRGNASRRGFGASGKRSNDLVIRCIHAGRERLRPRTRRRHAARDRTNALCKRAGAGRRLLKTLRHGARPLLKGIVGAIQHDCPICGERQRGCLAAHIIEHVQKVILAQVRAKARLHLAEHGRTLLGREHVLRAVRDDAELRLLGMRAGETRHFFGIICRNLKDERVCAAGKTLLGLGCAHLAPCELIRIEERIDEIRAGLHVPAICIDRTLVEIHHRHGNPA